VPDEVADEDVVSDPELITRVRAGDRAAFGELYRRHSGPATTLSRQFARSAAESDDLVSESFARVLDNLLSGKGPDTAFRAYLFTTIRNTAYDRTRKDKRLQFTDDMTTHDVAVVGDDPVLAKMESGLVATAFAQLPERWQAVLWHTQVEGESPAKVGALLGMAPGAVSSLAFRAREGLREAYLQAHLAETAAEQCRKTVESLGAWTRGGLSKREKAQVDAHLETCDRCRALAAELEEVNSGLRGLLAPLLLGGAAAGYLATLGPVAPLAAPGTLAAGAAASGGAGSGGAGSGTTAGGAGTGGAAGGGGTAGAGAAGAAGGSAAATTGAAVAASAAVVAAGAVGAAAYANAQTGGSSAGGAGAAGGTAAGGAAAAGTGAGGAAAGGLAGVVASMGVGGLVATGAALLVAAVAAVVFVVSGNSPETTTAADQPGSSSQSAPGGTSAAGNPAGTGPATAGGTGASAADGAGASAGPQGSGSEPETGTEATALTGADVPVGDAVAQVAQTPSVPASADAGDATAPANGSPGATSTAAASTADISGARTSSTSIPSSNPPDTSSTATNPPLSPFAIVISPFSAPSLTAGGTGVVTVTVANTGDQSAPVQPLTVTVPTGVSVTGVDVTPGGAALRRSSLQLEAVPCAPGDAQTCTSELPEIAGHSSLVVTISLGAEPTVFTGSVTIQVGTVNAQPIPISAASPIASLTLNTNAPLVAGTANSRTITVGTVNGVTDPGAITLTSGNANGTFGGSASCVPPTGGNSITCSGTSIDVSIVIPNKLFAGPLPITITDAGGRQRSLALTVVTPADLQLSPLTIAEPLIAGGGGQLALTVQNTGGLSSTPQSIDASLPDGVTVAGVTAGNTLICKGLGGACLLPEIGPGESVSLVVDLHVCRCVIAHPFPPATVIIGGITGETASTQLTVGSGIAALTTVPDGPFVAGSRNPLTVTATVVKGVTNPGKVTFTSTSKFVSFGDAKNCDKVKPPGTGVSAIKCDGTSYPMTITITKDQPPGNLPVLAIDAGGRNLPLLDADGHPMQVVAPERLQLSELTVAKAVQAGGAGSLTLTVTNLNSDPSERMDIGITLDKPLILFHVDGLGAGPLSGNCGPFWHKTCRLPAIGTDPLTLTFTVLAPRTAQSGTLSVTIDHTKRSNTFAVVPAPATDALSITLGPPHGPAAEPPASAGGDQEADLMLGQNPAASGSDVHTAEPPLANLLDSGTTPTESSAPETTSASGTASGSETASGSTTGAPRTTTSAPGTTASVATTSAAPASTDPPPGTSVLPDTNAPSSTGSPAGAPQSGAASAPLTNRAPADTDIGAGDPPTTSAPADVRLSAPVGGDSLVPGGDMTLGFTAGNTGGDWSTETPIDVGLPEGVEVQRITVDGNTVCTTGEGCFLPALRPGATVPVVVEVRVRAGASGGAALITVNGSGVGWRLVVLPPPPSATTHPPTTEPPTTEPPTAEPSTADREPPG
jgi:RNA polymerase sigma factor (sigma-70 family)